MIYSIKKIERFDTMIEACKRKSTMVALFNIYFRKALDQSQDINMIKEKINVMTKKYKIQLKDLSVYPRLKNYYLANGDSLEQSKEKKN
jgi:hypothetical protein